MPLTPKNRKEEWLQGLVDHETTLTPKNRPEEWMKEIIDASGGGGGGGGVLVVHATGNYPDLVLDKTAGEIAEAYNAGITCFVITGNGTDYVITYMITTFAYDAAAVDPDHAYTFNAGQFVWVADSATDYPILGDR